MFDNVIGHNNQKKLIKSDIEKNKLSHAYAFVGPTGIGKKKLAEEFAKVLLGVEDLNIALDYKYITRLEGKKNILIEQIRKEIVEDVYIVPSSGRYKIYVVDNAEYLNEEAQNALLKTLEEPPSYVCIILITENIQSFLSTIVSRVKQIRFNELTNEDIKKFSDLNGEYKLDLDDNMIMYIDGSIGKFVELNDQKEYDLFKKMEELVESIKNKNEFKSLKIIEDISMKNSNVINYLEYLFYFNNMYSYIIYLEEAKRKLIYNGNEDIVKTVLITTICRKEKIDERR